MKKWEKYEEEGFLLMDAEELEGKYFDNTILSSWVSFHRLILYNFSKEEFTLSGIGQVFDNKFIAPKDAGKAFIGNTPEYTHDLTKVYYDYDINWWTCYDDLSLRNCRDRALAIHMSCWKLAQWIIGPGIEKSLELFIAIALRNIFKISRELWEGVGIPAYINERPGMLGEGLFRPDDDPYRIPLVQRVIDSSRVIKAPAFFTQPPWYSKISDLPTEIFFEILDLLDCNDISKLKVALRVNIADCYWRARSALNLIEIDEIPGEDLNWQYLCSKIEAVRTSSFEFESRRYVVDLLRNEIKPTYLRNLKKRDFPCLEEVINECQDKMWLLLCEEKYLDSLAPIDIVLGNFTRN